MKMRNANVPNAKEKRNETDTHVLLPVSGGDSGVCYLVESDNQVA